MFMAISDMLEITFLKNAVKVFKHLRPAEHTRGIFFWGTESLKLDEWKKKSAHHNRIYWKNDEFRVIYVNIFRFP